MTRALFLLILAASLAVAFIDDEEAKALPDGAGKEVTAKVCLECHGAGHFRGQRLTQTEWSDKVYEMMDNGAKATDDEVTAVVAYLTKNFGKESKVWVNTAPLVELKSVLGFSIPEGDAIVAYRKDHPPFKEWRDLLNVPGVDAKKAESLKDKMLF